MQALTDSVVQCVRGYPDVFAALLPEWRNKHIRFENIRCRDGLILSGEWNKGRYRIAVNAPREMATEIHVGSKRHLLKLKKVRKKVITGIVRIKL